MSPPQLNVYRHDNGIRTLLTPTGEIDLATRSLLRDVLAGCLDDGIRTVDIDLTSVTFCDCSGLNVFLESAQRLTAAGGMLLLHHPGPAVTRMMDITGAGFLLSR